MPGRQFSRVPYKKNQQNHTFSQGSCSAGSPRNSSGLQHVGDAHVPGPDVKLPLLQAQHATQDGARVDPDPHVHVEVQLLLHVSEFFFFFFFWWAKSSHS